MELSIFFKLPKDLFVVTMTSIAVEITNGNDNL